MQGGIGRRVDEKREEMKTNAVLPMQSVQSIRKDKVKTIGSIKHDIMEKKT